MVVGGSRWSWEGAGSRGREQVVVGGMEVRRVELSSKNLKRQHFTSQ